MKNCLTVYLIIGKIGVKWNLVLLRKEKIIVDKI